MAGSKTVALQVVVRSLRVVKLLGTVQRGLSLAEISGRLELPVATTHRILAVLVAEQFVSRSVTNRRYFLGPAVQELVHASTPRESPLVTAHSAVARASRASGETVFLAELSGDRVVCLALSESQRPLRLFVRVGQTMPLHAAASARVLLAWRESDFVRKILGEGRLPAFTGETPTTAGQVLDRLRLIRSRGYDVCDSELDDHVWAVSAPVRSSTNAVVASVTLAAPGSRVSSESDRQTFVGLVRVAASEMSSDLGWNGAEISA